MKVYDGTTLLGSTTADGNGMWSYTPATPLLTGGHDLTVGLGPDHVQRMMGFLRSSLKLSPA